MLNTTNKPYVKKYKNGVLVNPIKGKYSTNGMNRQTRRRGEENSSRLMNNRGKHSVTVYRDLDDKTKMRKARVLVDKNGVLHYLTK